MLQEKLEKHKECVKDKLKKHLDQSECLTKYLWSANYHNFFCDEYSDIDDEYKIDLSKYQMQPTFIR